MTDEQLGKLIEAITYKAWSGYSLYEVCSRLGDMNRNIEQTNELLKKKLSNPLFRLS